MVKNTTGGKHHKKYKNKNETVGEVRNFPWPDNDMTFFGKVTTLFGGNMVEVTIEKIAHKCRIPGTFRKKVWIGKGDLVLVHQDSTCDVSEIIFVYKASEVNMIKAMGVWEDVEEQAEDNGDVLFQNDTELDVNAI